jgi:NAD(P)-dependent dehydrogenase (short-subunit alcohol dehydrogenase family)
MPDTGSWGLLKISGKQVSFFTAKFVFIHAIFGLLTLLSSFEISIDQVRAQFNVNLLGPLRTIKAALPSMRERGSGTIVNISSTNGIISMPGLGVYGASKFALEGMASSFLSLFPTSALLYPIVL